MIDKSFKSFNFQVKKTGHLKVFLSFKIIRMFFMLFKYNNYLKLNALKKSEDKRRSCLFAIFKFCVSEQQEFVNKIHD